MKDFEVLVIHEPSGDVFLHIIDSKRTGFYIRLNAVRASLLHDALTEAIRLLAQEGKS